jgi:NADPH:quinone reductase-like Zn-dependent oxidoreductase
MNTNENSLQMSATKSKFPGTKTTMKAIETKKYGSADVFKLNEIARPVPKANEVLIRVFASTVTASDIMMREGKPLIGRLFIGLRRPKNTIPGFDFAGEVVEVGSEVTLFNTGDRVFGGSTALGCYAEYVCVNSEDVLSTIPENTSYEEAAPFSGSAITVWNFLKAKGDIQKNQKVLINGASGGLGTYAVQIAKYFGAEVTGVCSTGNVEMVKSLGADHVIDYTKEDFTKVADSYDIIFDTVGKRTFSQCNKSLKQNGIYLSAVMSFPLFIQSIFSSFFGNKKAITSATGLLPAKVRLQYLLELKQLMKAGKIKSVIDHSYPLAQMAEAHKYVEKGHKKGNVVISI